jgi:hypothetical protein
VGKLEYYYYPFSSGSCELYWVSYYLFPELFIKKGFYKKENSELLNEWFELCGNCGFIYTFENVCIICDRPYEIHMLNNRLHNANGPAIKFSDGYELYTYKGIRLTDNEHLIKEKGNITIDSIMKEKNTEIRRIAMELYGIARFLKDYGAEMIHEDETGKLWKKEIPGDEPIVMIELINSTPEPDWTYKTYWERVHPELRPMKKNKNGIVEFGEPQKMLARNAVASRVGKRGEEYHPLIET